MLQLQYTSPFEKYPLVPPSGIPTKASYREGKEKMYTDKE